MSLKQLYDTKSVEYKIWNSIKNRCFPSSSRSTKEESLGMQEEWIDCFQAFLDDVGFRPSNTHKLIRIDSNKGFYKKNVCWALEQNKQRNYRYFLTYNAITLPLKEWCDRYSINYGTALKRKKSGWSDEAIIETPADTTNKHKKHYKY